MNNRYKKIFKYSGTAVIVAIIFFSGVKVNNWIEWKMAEKVIASGGYPVEAGIINVVAINCFTTGNPPVCTGGTLCTTKDAASCTMYSDVSGTGAYAMGGDQSDFKMAMAGTTNLLLSNIAIGQAGLTNGGQLIAGGMSPSLMDSGVLASAGGCSGCMAKSGFFNGVKEKFKFIIAGFKE
ncbi:hypothetical protein KAU09_02060 [Candidatus Parcubacteria bacterium]|nr:hypothetical protein [Candidatus Parcubacteria bacterium]